jgi:hypothetical protein
VKYYPVDSDEYRDRRDAMDDRMSPLDLAVEAATQIHATEYLDLHTKYLNLKDEDDRLRTAFFEINAILRIARYKSNAILRNDLTKTRVPNAQKDEFVSVGLDNIRLRTALYEINAILRNDLTKYRVSNALDVIKALELPDEEPTT